MQFLYIKTPVMHILRILFTINTPIYPPKGKHMYSNLEEWLIISHSGISHIKFNKLLQIFKDPKAILSATKQQLLQYGIAKKSIDLIHRPDKKKIKYALKWSQYSGHFILTKNNPHYPAQLLPYSYLPNVLFVQGDYKDLQQLVKFYMGYAGVTNY